MDRFFIRRLVKADASVFRGIRLEGLRLHPEAFGASLEDEQQQSLTFFSERVMRNTVLGGFDSPRSLQGVIGVRYSDPPKTRHVASIWGMYVRQDARGLGLSRKLLGAALQDAKSRCRSVRLSVVSTNEAARRLYQSMGFVEWALDNEALNVNGAFYDKVLMRLDYE